MRSSGRLRRLQLVVVLVVGASMWVSAAARPSVPVYISGAVVARADARHRIVHRRPSSLQCVRWCQCFSARVCGPCLAGGAQCNQCGARVLMIVAIIKKSKYPGRPLFRITALSLGPVCARPEGEATRGVVVPRRALAGLRLFQRPRVGPALGSRAVWGRLGRLWRV